MKCFFTEEWLVSYSHHWLEYLGGGIANLLRPSRAAIAIAYIISYRTIPTFQVPFLNFQNCTQDKFLKFIYSPPHLINLRQYWNFNYVSDNWLIDQWNSIFRRCHRGRFHSKLEILYYTWFGLGIILIFIKLKILHPYCGPGGSSGTALDYYLDDPDSIPGGGGGGDFSSFLRVQIALRSTQPPIKWVPGPFRG